MQVLVIRNKATKEEIQEMLKSLGDYIKVAVDISRGILAGGGGLHADAEAVLIEQGSRQEDLWGADWFPETKELRYEAMINIAPRRNNRSTEIKDPSVRGEVAKTVRALLEIE